MDDKPVPAPRRLKEAPTLPPMASLLANPSLASKPSLPPKPSYFVPKLPISERLQTEKYDARSNVSSDTNVAFETTVREDDGVQDILKSDTDGTTTVIPGKQRSSLKHFEHSDGYKRSPSLTKETDVQKEKIDTGSTASKMDSSPAPKSNKSKLKHQKENNIFLYLRLEQLVKDNVDLHGLLMERMQKQSGMNFEIVDKVSKAGEDYTIVTLNFPSKRLGETARNLLNLSNRRSQFKICSTFDKAQVDDSKKVEKDVAVFQEQLQRILNQAKQTLKNHDQKIQTTFDGIQKLKTKKHMPIDEFERVTSERYALEDKLNELKLQNNEFKRFRESLTAKMKTSWEDNTFVNNINEIRKLFGVECCRLDAALPMYARRSEIVNIVKENQVCVILGETGSGKSTQMTQYLHQVGFGNNGIIACTQPRKVAAISLATRVAQEMATNVGQLVGYRVGMQSKECKNTQILYTTDHALLNECLKDKTLSKYSCVIIDEAHERSIYTDLLLGMIKRCLDSRPDLKILITSATIDPDIFVRYFNGCPVLKISGRMFPVEVIWQPLSSEVDVFENYQQAAIQKAIEIHTKQPYGDILVFMTTPLETEKCCTTFKETINVNTYQCLVLHGQLQAAEQQLVFQPTPPGKRKIVFATNSAETSITIPGIKYVVDTGLVKEKRYDPKKNMSSLNVVMVSRSSAEQRKGRAGRTGPGMCYRLYSEEQYKDMETASLPEILKIHLGQAMLKLAELGINPLEYDFVQSPEKAAIEGAIRMLEDIGAIKDQHITEQGKWLVKLPVEPRLGSIIAKGKELDVLYESVVLSAVSSVGSFIFYRGGSETDKKESDLRKVEFCHYGGDSMSLLNVFKEWNKQPEKKKNGWCFEHSVNSKAIRSARDMVNEICTLLKKDLGLVVTHSFGDSSSTDKILQQILFECFSANICHFLGHERAGYYVARLDQVVNIHPSSVLNPLGLVPQWVVFEQVLKTSKDFVTGITPVEDSVVQAAADNGNLRYDIELMKNKQVYPIYTECVGSRAFWRIVGPSFRNLKTLQEKACHTVAPSCAVIEADKEKGEFKLFTTREKSEILAGILKPDILEVQSELLLEDAEHALSEQTDSVKVAIGTGGEVTQVLMPDDYRTVFIENPQEYTIEDTIRAKFGQFGIKECRMFKNRKNDRWGCVTFGKTENAKKAVISTHNDQYEVAIAENRGQGRNNQTFQAKITWCRRMSKLHAFVNVAPEVLPRILAHSMLWIRGMNVYTQLDKKTGSSLFLNRLSSDINEEDIKIAILEALDFEESRDVIERVTVVREKVETTPEMLNVFTSRLKAAIREHAPSGQFRVEVITPQPQSINYVAYAHFHHPDEGQNACRRLSGNLEMFSRLVTMVPDISTRMFVPSNVFRVVEQNLKESIEALKHLENKTTVRIKKLLSDNYGVDIHSSDALQMARTRSVLQDIIQGDVIECGKNSPMKHMFAKTGKQFLTDLQTKLECVIVVDDRTMTISIKGVSKVCTQARVYINNFLDKILDTLLKDISLRGPEKPGGVMKMLISRYEPDLDKLKKEMGLESIELDHRRHKVEVRGSPEAIEKTEAVIEDIITELAKVLTVRTRVDERPDCIVCFMPVECGQLYRLEACGHPYCLDCIKQQLQVALKNRDFPVECAHEECNWHFMWRDLSHFIKNGSILLKELVKSSVSDFVAKNQKDYRYCITPKCPVIHRVSSDGAMFQCCECQIAICTSCHIKFHNGFTCAMYRSEKEGGSQLFQQWMKKNKDAKRCPNCQIPVQKVSGCNQMQCYMCKQIFCWLCLDSFDSLQKCYAHLVKKHERFV